MGKLQFSNGCKIHNVLFERLGKVGIGQKLQVFEVMNKKQTCLNINFKYSRGWQKLKIQIYSGVRGEGANFLIFAIFKIINKISLFVIHTFKN